MVLRNVTQQDLEGIREVVDSSGLFPSEYLGEMIADYFDNPDSEDIWFTAIQDNRNVAVGYCAPEEFTDGTYNLYAIGVLKDLQGQGTGKAMMKYIEALLREKSARVLIVETSSSDQFELTRKFYRDLGYDQEGIIRDFWQEGEDKVIFWKKLH